ncbi:MAG: hypothetical protein P8090_10360 [Gammaproteobacteria bacterium]
MKNGVVLCVASSFLLAIGMAVLVVAEKHAYVSSVVGEFFAAFILWGVLGGVFLLIGALVIGVPVAILLKKVGMFRWYIAVPIGVLVSYWFGGTGFINRYLIAAVLLGPLAVFPAMLIGESLLWIGAPAVPTDLVGQYHGAVLVAAVGLAYAYPLTLVYGVPAFLILRRHRLDRLWIVIGAGMVPVAALWALNTYPVELFGVYAYFATWVSAACWIIAVWLPAREAERGPKPRGRTRPIGPFVFFTAVVTTVSLMYIALDKVPRYLSWRDLNVGKIKQEALRYSSGQPVCLYVVDCSTDVARLKLIRNEAGLDIDKLKDVFWRRRFDGYCKGYTEDIVIDIPDDLATGGRKDDARWSFYNDRFITNHGRFQGSAGSFYPYEKFTVNSTLWGEVNR